jgi:hypothetical protein
VRREDEALVGRELGDGRKAETVLVHLAGIEVLVAGDPDEPSVDTVRPPVVRAQEALGVALLGATDRVTAVHAGVQHGPDAAVLLPHDQHVVPAHHGREEIARLRDLRLVAQEQPRAAEDLLHLALEDRRVAVDPPIHLAALERDEVVDVGRRRRHARMSSRGIRLATHASMPVARAVAMRPSTAFIDASDSRGGPFRERGS